ncbi:MAG: hypothetical protein GKR86_07615, partial [Ilumatobacter sp.]|nr:hypothetical protein [Ilumatobacter sp.]
MPFPLGTEPLEESDFNAIQIAIEHLTSPATHQPTGPQSSLPNNSDAVPTTRQQPELTTQQPAGPESSLPQNSDAVPTTPNRPEATTTSSSDISDLTLVASDVATPVTNTDLGDVLRDPAKPIKAEDLVVQDVIPTQHNGVTLVYLQQQRGGIDVAGAIANVAVKDGKVAFEASKELSAAIPGTEVASLGPIAALQRAAIALDLTPTAPTRVVEEAVGSDRTQTLSDSGIAARPIPARLVYQKVDEKSVRLAWEFEIETIDRANIWQILIDADDGKALERNNLIIHETFDGKAHANGSPKNFSEPPAWLIKPGSTRAAMEAPSNANSSYNVFAQPLEAPSFGDRSEQVDPFDSNASPFGWHDTDGVLGGESTLTVGNNVSAY